MGDVLSLIEKAQESFDEKKAAELEQKLRQSTFTFSDYLDQCRQLKKMGSLEQLVGMLPGMKGVNLNDAKIDEKQIDRMEAMILSMTPEEREKPELMNGSRKKRIAAGSGTSVEELNRFIKQFEQIQKMMKQFAGGGGGFKKKFGRFGKGLPF